MPRLRRILVGGALAAFVACTLPSADEFSHTAAATSPDGSPSVNADAPVGPLVDAAPDAARAADADADGAAAPVELLPAGDSTFDDGTCGPDSGGYESQLASSTLAHTGAGACQVCRTDTSAGGAYTIDTGVPAKPHLGDVFVATAWVRRPPGATDRTPVGLTLRTHNGDFVGIDQADSPPVVLSDAYQLLSLRLPITKGGRFMDVFVGTMPPVDVSPACFLVDDLFVARQ